MELDSQVIASFLTLVLMETVLGIDNIVFISILTNKLPHHEQKKARVMGMALALVFRIILLLSISWIMTLTTDWFNVARWLGFTNDIWETRLAISGRDLVLVIGGFFLIYKSNKEIHDSIEAGPRRKNLKTYSLMQTVIQIGLLDIVFGLDSVITAIGMADEVFIMIAAVAVAMVIMLIASNAISLFISQHPSVKLLALAFLLLIGVSLVAEGIEMAIPKGFIYFAMAFSVFVEFLILRLAKNKKYVSQLQEDERTDF